MRFLCTLLLVAVAGCGNKLDEGVKTEKVRHLTVRDHDGVERVLPQGELVDPESGQLNAKEVLVLDRRGRRKVWLDADEFRKQPPNNSRFVPVLSDQIATQD